MEKLFGKYGPVTSAKVMAEPDGSSRGFGFVCFENREYARKALDLHEQGVDGISEKLYVVQALKKKEREAELKRKNESYKNSWLISNLYVKNFGTETSDQELLNFFSQYGEIKNVQIMKDSDG